MKRESILKTTLVYWSEDDDCYVAESPLFDAVLADGDTVNEALNHYKRALNAIYIEYLEGNVLGYPRGRGRPAKGGTTLHTLINPEVKAQLQELSKQFEISLGEVVEYLAFFYEKHHEGQQITKANANRPKLAKRGTKRKSKSP